MRCRAAGVYVPGPRAMEGTDPVNKKLAAALSGGAVLVLALSGCSDDSGDKKLDAWAKKVCDQVQPQVKKIRRPTPPIQQATADRQQAGGGPEDRLAGLPGHLRRLQGAGRRREQGRGRRRSTTARSRRRTPSRNSTAISSGVRRPEEAGRQARHQGPGEVRRRPQGRRRPSWTSSSKSGDDALKKLQAGDVGKAMAKQDGCQKPTASGRRRNAVTARRAAVRSRDASGTAGRATGPAAPRGGAGPCRCQRQRPQWAGEYDQPLPTPDRLSAPPGCGRRCWPPPSPPTGCSTCSARPPTRRWPAARPCPRCGPPAATRRWRRSSGCSCCSSPCRTRACAGGAARRGVPGGRLAGAARTAADEVARPTVDVRPYGGPERPGLVHRLRPGLRGRRRGRHRGSRRAEGVVLGVGGASTTLAGITVPHARRLRARPRYRLRHPGPARRPARHARDRDRPQPARAALHRAHPRAVRRARGRSARGLAVRAGRATTRRTT